MAVFDTADFKLGFWLMLGAAAALVILSLIMKVFGKVA